ncbi:MAG TPA: amino-acid N-acetyltransferase [Pseudolysinimonas sp.]|nr:amino-acid N-acetyltransferase [Pseudolysinimonas sp.]
MTSDSAAQPFTVRAARTADVPGIQALIAPFVEQNILLNKQRVVYYEAVQEFRVAVAATPGSDAGEIIGCGALHVIWDDLGEVRTLAAAEAWRGAGVGHAILSRLEDDARQLGLTRLFCLTFETEFFASHGFTEIGEGVVSPDVYAELERSHDEGVAEFLDLARVKPNTLGNTRMLKRL